MKMDTIESYELLISEGKVVLISENYVGFLRGLETFYQLVEKKSDHLIIKNTPLII